MFASRYTYGLASLDELYQQGRMEEVFAPVYAGAPGSAEQ
jgi:hypothetical protein